MTEDIQLPSKARELQNHHFASTIWNGFKFRTNIVIATYAKDGRCGRCCNRWPGFRATSVKRTSMFLIRIIGLILAAIAIEFSASGLRGLFAGLE